MHKKYLLCLLILPNTLIAADSAHRLTEEHVEVVGRLPNYLQALSRVLPQTPLVNEHSRSVDSLATILSQSPTINLNGQGGLFQTVNIRGFARWRVNTLVEGIPIYTERRAGTAAEFIPPSMLGQAYLIEGAASTQLGSGAMGGGLGLYLAQPERQSLTTTYGVNQSYRDWLWQGGESVTWGANTASTDQPLLHWQVNHRQANNSSDAEGKPIYDQFEQSAASLRYQRDQGLIKEGLFIASSASNVRKASADLPTKRSTLYPSNDHVLGKITLDWHNAAFYFHQSTLQTQTHRPGKRSNFTQNEALDIGFQFSDQWKVADGTIHWRVGLDGRTGVKADEQEWDAEGRLVFDRINLDGEQWEAALSGDYSRPLRRGSFVAGTRLSQFYQRHRGQSAADDSAGERTHYDENISGFMGYNHTLSDAWAWSTYVSSAYRVPSLTERFFHGATPRGTVLGDENLQPEAALNTQSSVRYEGDSAQFTLTGFIQRIDHYIERVTINDELRQYRNLEQAEITGVNYQWQWSPLPNSAINTPFDWAVTLGGQWLWGEDQAGNAIADIAPAQHRLGVNLSGEKMSSFIALTHRQSSDERVNGELPTEAVTTLDAGMNLTVSERTSLALNLTNITNQRYVTSRDDLAPNARGRDLQLTLTLTL